MPYCLRAMERPDRGVFHLFLIELSHGWPNCFQLAEGVLKEKGVYDTLMFSPSGPAGVFALYVLPGTNLHRVLMNEFVTVSIRS
jgi:hypothetical protein